MTTNQQEKKSSENSTNENGGPVVAVDLDGVLAKYDHWRGHEYIGEPIEGARNFLENLREKFHVMIYTARTLVGDDENFTGGLSQEQRAQIVKNWLALYLMPYDSIWTGTGKPYAEAYIDDRAIECRPQEQPWHYKKALVYLGLKKPLLWGQERNAI